MDGRDNEGGTCGHLPACDAPALPCHFHSTGPDGASCQTEALSAVARSKQDDVSWFDSAFLHTKGKHNNVK